MITFDAEAHIYRLNGKQLQSVSDWISQFTPVFQADAIAEKCAIKEGKTKQWILDKWEQKKNISLHRGNWVHESIEYYLKYDKEFTNEPVEAFKKHETENVYHSEVIVHNDELAGTIDLIEVVEKGKVILHDFKTNEDLEKKSGKMLGRFSHLDNTPMNKYRIQLNKYKELLEGMRDVEVLALKLWHYKDGDFSILDVGELQETKVLKI